jgi:putative intracellular protease/amidase
MKKHIILNLTMLAAGAASLAADLRPSGVAAEYFRVWAGFKRPELDVQSFKQGMSAFVDETRELYKGRGLSDYLVMIPPANKPAFVPDELALVALDSEQAYRAVRNTPEGQAYSQNHWKIFDRSNSQSAPRVVNYFQENPQSLESGLAYDLIGEPIDWSRGYTRAFLGVRKEGVSQEDFLRNLSAHIRLAATNLRPLGMQAYIVLANKDYEVAYIHWASREAHDLAFSRSEGSQVFVDAGRFMTPLMYAPVEKILPGAQVEEGHAYANLKIQKTLLVLTSHSDLGSSGKKTGYYLPELVHPLNVLEQNGVEVELASPQGGAAPVDPASIRTEDSEIRTFISRRDMNLRLGMTLKLEEAVASDYHSVFYVGGHGTMWDFLTNKDIDRLTREIFENEGVVAAVCHGPAALINVRLSSGAFLLSGQNTTGFSDAEELAYGLDKVVPYSLEQALRSRGVKYSKAPSLWQENVAVNPGLVTGQNPASARSTAVEMLRQVFSRAH